MPVKLCCGKRHSGAQCADGKVMCALCFIRFPVEELNKTEDGTPEDVCIDCATEEELRGG